MNLTPKGILFIYILQVFVKFCETIDFFEFFVGPRIGRSMAAPTSFQISAAQNFVEGFGYPFEAHEVVSQSGYILSLHRVPNGLKRNRASSVKRPVVLIQHGLMAASDTWLARGPDFDFPYVLADAGYDVWLGNMRGNLYSRAHQTLNPDRDQEYWNFSLEEVAYNDYPVIFDYILNVTKQENLYFIGHSAGSTLGIILCSLRPEYNSKIKLHLGLAPLMYVGHSITFVQSILVSLWLPITQQLLANQIFNIFPRQSHFSKFLETFCKDGTPTQELCVFSLYYFTGRNSGQFNTSLAPLAVSLYPAGTSIYLAQHALQMYLYRNLSPFNYENKILNLKRYNTTVPPPYNISVVTHPVSLHYGHGDIFITKEDVELTEKKLPNPVGIFPVPHKDFNHMDFMWGTDAKNLLYDRLIVLIDKYR